MNSYLIFSGSARLMDTVNTCLFSQEVSLLYNLPLCLYTPLIRKVAHVCIHHENGNMWQQYNQPPLEYYTFACVQSKAKNKCNDENDDEAPSRSIPNTNTVSATKLPTSFLCSLSLSCRSWLRRMSVACFSDPALLANKGNWRTSKSRTQETTVK